MKKGVSWVTTDYVVPSEVCAMFNVVLDAKNQVIYRNTVILQIQELLHTYLFVFFLQSLKLCTIDGVDVVSTPFLLFKLFFNLIECFNSVNVFLAQVPRQNR